MKKFDLKTKRPQPERLNLEDVKEFQPLSTNIMRRKYVWYDELIDARTKNEIMKQGRFGLWHILLKENRSSNRRVRIWYFFDSLWQQLIYKSGEPFIQRRYVLKVVTEIIEYALEILGFTHLMVEVEELQFASRKMAEWLVMSFGEKKIENDRPTLFYKTCKCITAGRPA